MGDAALDGLGQLRVLVLAAGKSTRIASVADGLPKPLLEVGGRSVLAGNLAWLRRAGICSVWINLHFRPEAIRSALDEDSQLGLRINYSHEETILGTAGALKRVAEDGSGHWLVIYGDNLMRFDIHTLLGTHRRQEAVATIALFDPDSHVNTRIAGGRVVLGSNGFIEAFVEGGTGGNPAARYVNAGAYVLEPEALAHIGGGFQDFGKDVFPQLVTEGRVAGHVIERDGFCLGLDTPESLDLARELVRTRQVIVT